MQLDETGAGDWRATGDRERLRRADPERMAAEPSSYSFDGRGLLPDESPRFGPQWRLTRLRLAEIRGHRSSKTKGLCHLWQSP